MILPLYVTFILSLWYPAAPLQATESFVRLSGKILDAKTGKAVKAKITYTSVPFGNVTGIRHFEGHYQLLLQPKVSYHFEVHAQGYLPLEVTLTTYLEDSVRHDFYLQKPYQKGEVMHLPDKILFERGEADITPSSYDILQTLLQILEENPGMHIRLEGHTDRGAQESLMSLSEERVASVRKYLVKQGIRKSRIKTKAFGGTVPLSHDNTPEAHSLNRRVEIRIMKL